VSKDVCGWVADKTITAANESGSSGVWHNVVNPEEVRI
jgi:hypothetical protein